MNSPNGVGNFAPLGLTVQVAIEYVKLVHKWSE